jgi:hypothetical protein
MKTALRPDMWPRAELKLQWFDKLLMTVVRDLPSSLLSSLLSSLPSSRPSHLPLVFLSFFLCLPFCLPSFFPSFLLSLTFFLLPFIPFLTSFPSFLSSFRSFFLPSFFSFLPFFPSSFLHLLVPVRLSVCLIYFVGLVCSFLPSVVFFLSSSFPVFLDLIFHLSSLFNGDGALRNFSIAERVSSGENVVFCSF